MALGDIYEFKLSCSPPNIGDEALNLFYYELISGEVTDMNELWEEFHTTVVVPMLAAQSNQVGYNYCRISNLFSLTEFLDHVYDPTLTVGALSEVSAPPSTAVNFTLRRAAKTTRNGAKRLTGIPNSSCDRGFIDDAGYLGILNTLRDAFDDHIVGDVDIFELQPVIVKRVKEANSDYPDNSKYPFKYRLPTNPSEKIVSPLSGVSFSQFTSTQVSRKTNR